MKQLNKQYRFVAVVIFAFSSSVYADEENTISQPSIQLTVATNNTDFILDTTTVSAVPVPIQTVQGVDPFIALTGIIVGYMVADKINSTTEQFEQKKKIPNLLRLSQDINPHLLLKNQFSTELIKQPKWSDGRSYQLDIEPEYHLSSALNTMKMVFKYQLKTSKPNTPNESIKAQIYIFHNSGQEINNAEKTITWENINEVELKNTFLESANLLSDAFSKIDVNQKLNSDFVIATTMNDEKIRGYIIQQDQNWLWLLDQNKNIYILKPKRTFVLSTSIKKIDINQ